MKEMYCVLPYGRYISDGSAKEGDKINERSLRLKAIPNFLTIVCLHLGMCTHFTYLPVIYIIIMINRTNFKVVILAGFKLIRAIAKRRKELVNVFLAGEIKF